MQVITAVISCAEVNNHQGGFEALPIIADACQRWSLPASYNFLLLLVFSGDLKSRI